MSTFAEKRVWVKAMAEMFAADNRPINISAIAHVADLDPQTVRGWLATQPWEIEPKAPKTPALPYDPARRCPDAIDWAELRTAAQENRRSKGDKTVLNTALINAWRALHPDARNVSGASWEPCREKLIDELDELRPNWRGYLCSYQQGAA